MNPLSLLALSALVFVAPSPARQQDNCTGCNGSGGTATSSGGTCGGMVSITVQVDPGNCHWIQSTEELLFECIQMQGCKTTITRTWSGLPAGSDVDFCIVVDGDKLCLKPKTPVGSSKNGEPRQGPTLDCTDAPGSGLTFTVESAACGLSAEVHANCTGCEGDI